MLMMELWMSEDSLDSLSPGFLDSWIPGFLNSHIPDSQFPGFYCFFSLQIIEEACKKKLRKKHFVIWYFLYTKIMSVQLNNEKIIIVDFERVDDFLHKRKQTNKLFLVIKAKLYIPSTLNIALLQWHTHLNVCAVK